MAFKPTAEQENAINAPSGALVSAAAGSGKTAVLVERVIRKICGENPIPADKLLVVTFTNSAAAEMRIRIENRLNEECRKNPHSRELLKQKIRLKNSKICTIDSFCIDLIRENFDRLNISPDFAIADSAAVSVLEEQAMNETLDNAYENDCESFKTLLEAASNDYDEGSIKDNIKSLYYYSQNMPFPDAFLQELTAKTEDNNSFEQLKGKAFSAVRENAERMVIELSAAVEMLRENEKVFEKYSPALLDDITNLGVILRLCEEKDWDGLHNVLNKITYTPYGAVKGAGDYPPLVSAKFVREREKSVLNDMAAIFAEDEENTYKDFVFGNFVTRELLRLTADFSLRFEEKRREKGVMTFTDTEHCALELLCEYQDGKIKVKDSAEDIIGRFSEVLVDEFQDTNNMQDILFSVLSDNEKKIFIVGDIKQSIYRFRGANPKNFLEKKNRYVNFERARENDLKKIILSSNFRSRAGVCTFVNFLFEILMNGDLSSVKYNSEEMLVPLAEYPENGESCVEISYVDVDKASDAHAADAENIAEFIKRFMAESYVTDTVSGQLRRPAFSDFTILLRAIKSDGAKYAAELEKYGIPVAYSTEDFLSRTEIQIMLSLLSFIENQTRDIELLSVMMSPMFSFSADEVAKIRLIDKNVSLFSAVTARAESNKKCGEFVETISRFKNYFVSKSISELICAIYDETDFLNIVSVLTDGEARKKNLLLLQSMAESYDNYGFAKNISGFINHVKKTASGKIKSAPCAEEKDAVKITTIHDSKGLQYPVCILANTTYKFSKSDEKAALLIDEKLGAALKFNDASESSKKSFLTLNIIIDSMRREQLDEELRLLYVALTRAKEKLFISVADKGASDFILNLSNFVRQSDSADMYREYAGSFKSYAELISFAVMLHPDIKKYRNAAGVFGYYQKTDSKIEISFKHSAALETTAAEEEIKSIDSQKPDESLIAQLKQSLNYSYPYAQLKEIESKAAVADIARKAETRDFSFTSQPSFMMKKGLTPAERGTATHRFMQFCDFAKAKENIEKEAFRLYDYEFITEKERDAIDLNSVGKFFESRLFERIMKADRVEREMRFITEMPAGKLNPSVSDSVKDEKIVVQGSVDCVFIEDGELVVLDFKTDRVKSADDLSEAYAQQLNIYSGACEKIFEMPVKEKLIYSFALSCEITID